MVEEKEAELRLGAFNSCDRKQEVSAILVNNSQSVSVSVDAAVRSLPSQPDHI